MTSKLLFLAGSTRKDSVNKKLAKAAHDIAKTMDVEATYIDLTDFDMPIYNGDLEEESGLPEKAIELKKLFIENNGFCLACPEYNGTFTPVLLNALNWMSRPNGDLGGLDGYKGKTCAILAASPGGLGGLRGLVDIRKMLSAIGVHVIPDQLAVGSAYGKFDDNGIMTDENDKQRLTSVIESLVKTTNALK
ncbi:MAG: NAD(P)H-dependent oxidoreductase [Pseudomonadota bacterium]